MNESSRCCWWQRYLGPTYSRRPEICSSRTTKRSTERALSPYRSGFIYPSTKPIKSKKKHLNPEKTPQLSGFARCATPVPRTASVTFGCERGRCLGNRRRYYPSTVFPLASVLILWSALLEQSRNHSSPSHLFESFLLLISPWSVAVLVRAAVCLCPCSPEHPATTPPPLPCPLPLHLPSSESPTLANLSRYIPQTHPRRRLSGSHGSERAASHDPSPNSGATRSGQYGGEYSSQESLDTFTS